MRGHGLSGRACTATVEVMATLIPGTPVWCDLSTPDVPTARAFYGAVIGWSFAETPSGGSGWISADTADGPVAGIGPIMGDYPPSWTVYLASADTDTDIARAIELGGALFGGPMDIGAPDHRMGRMAVIGDPAGGVFGLWQPDALSGFAAGHAPGRPVWFEIVTEEHRVAAPFYREMYGWGERRVDDGHAVMFTADGDVAGMRGLTADDRRAGLPPAMWLPYFSVRDADRAVAAVRSAGGTVVHPPTESPYGRTALASDPAGALFAIADPVSAVAYSA